MFPDVAGEPLAGSSSGTFFTCSADGTVRLWGTEERTQTHQNRQNTLSRVSLVSPKRLKVSAFQLSPESSALQDLLNIIYMDGSTSTLLDAECPANPDKSGSSDPRTGIRAIGVSPDGRHLASGDRSGMLR